MRQPADYIYHGLKTIVHQLQLATKNLCHALGTHVCRPGFLLLCIAVPGLTACDQAKIPSAGETPPEVSVAPNTVVAGKPQTHLRADEAVLVEEEATASERILDLAYAPSPDDGPGPAGQGQVVDEKSLLPNMFDQQKKASKLSVSGGLLTDPEKEEYMDSVNGAEIGLKLRTN